MEFGKTRSPMFYKGIKKTNTQSLKGMLLFINNLYVLHSNNKFIPRFA